MPSFKKYLSFYLLSVFGIAAILTPFYKNYLVKRLEVLKQEPAEAPKPEYVDDEVLIKFNFNVELPKIIKPGLDFDKQAMDINDLDEKQPIVQVFKSQNIKTIEKVFKGVEEPQKELTKIKAKFSDKKVNEAEFLKIDLSRTYKLIFDKSISVEDQIQQLSESNQFEYVEPNYIVKTALIPNDPYYLDSYPDIIGDRDPSWNPPYDYQWNLKKINMEEAWDINTGSDSLKVAVVDTGVDCSHQEMIGQCLVGYDFVNNDADPIDDEGHGTHVAGLIGSLTNLALPNNKGIAGIAFSSRILPIKVLNENGSGSFDWVAQGIQYAAVQGAKVINMSLSNNVPITFIPLTLKEAIDSAFALNVVIVASAGNSSDDVGNGYWPANYPGVIAVGGTSEEDSILAFSNYGNVSVVAPGGESSCLPAGQNQPLGCFNILSLKASSVSDSDPRIIGPLNEKIYLRSAGTSMSSPHVSALAALLLANNALLDYREVKSTIEYTSLDLGDIGIDRTFGYGLINAQAALELPSPPPIAEITIPRYYGFPGGVSEIIGSATGSSFDHFSITLGEGENPNDWITDGVFLTGEGENPVEKDILATVDFSSYNPGTWTLKLEVFGNNQTRIERRVLVKVDPNLMPGWPQPLDGNTSGYLDESMFIATDLDNDGQKEIFSQSDGEYVYLWDVQGQLLPGFPKYVSYDQFINPDIGLGTPAVADLDDDGQKEIVYSINACKSQPPFYCVFRLDLIKKDGLSLPNWPKVIGPTSEYRTLSSPVISDIDNDGQKEIIVYESGVGLLHAYEYDGSELYDWPKNINNGGTISVGDINNSGSQEIVITNDQNIYVYKINPFGLKWSKNLLFPGNTESYYSWAKPTLVDLNNNGKLEIIVSAGSNNLSSSEGAVFIYDSNGNSYPNWPQNTRSINNNSGSWNGNCHRSMPTVGDVDGDGELEVIVGTSKGRVMIYKLNGDRYNILYGESTSSNFDRGLALSDLDADGLPDIIGGASRMMYNDGAFFAWPYNWTFGSPFFPGWPKNTLIFSAPQVTDVDLDGQVEIIALGKANLDEPDQIYVWKEGSINDQSFEWSVYGCDEERTGVFKRTIMLPSPSPSPSSSPSPSPTPSPPSGYSNLPSSLGCQVIIAQGNDNYIQVPVTISNPSLNIGGELTFEAWVSFPDIQEYEIAEVIKKEVIGENLADGVLYNLIYGKIFGEKLINAKKADLQQNRIYNTSSSPIFETQPDLWYHLSMVYNGNKIVLYVNGQYLGEGSQYIEPIFPDNIYLPFKIGSGLVGLKIDELRMSNIARDIPTNWDNQLYLNPLSADEHTIALWHFNDHLQDDSNYNNNGQAIGDIQFNCPTAVDLISFTATVQNKDILLQWETATELDNLGFNLYRAESEDGEKTQLNSNLIPSQNPGSPVGANYEFLDNNVLTNKTYFYWLEDVDIYGLKTLHGPVKTILSSSPAPSLAKCYRSCSKNDDCGKGLVCGMDWCPKGRQCFQMLQCYNPKCPDDRSCICTKPGEIPLPSKKPFPIQLPKLPSFRDILNILFER